MTPSAPFTLHAAAARWALTSESDGLHTILRLSRDEAPAAEQRLLDGTATLQAADLAVVVKLQMLGGIDWAYAIPPHADPKQAPHIGKEFAAPPGSFAARQQAWGQRHPELYASRHVVVAVAQVLFGILGVSALMAGLLPHLDVVLPRIPVPAIALPALPWPQVSLPVIPWPDLPLPAISLPAFTPPQWFGALLETLKVATPILIAMGIAIREARQRRQRRAAAAAVDLAAGQPGPPATPERAATGSSRPRPSPAPLPDRG